MVELLVHELEAQLGIERSAQEVSLEHLDLEPTSQGLRAIDERPADPGSLEFWLDEYGTDLVPQERDEPDDVPVIFPDPCLCFRKIHVWNALALQSQELLAKKWVRQGRSSAPNGQNILTVSWLVLSNHDRRRLGGAEFSGPDGSAFVARPSQRSPWHAAPILPGSRRSSMQPPDAWPTRRDGIRTSSAERPPNLRQALFGQDRLDLSSPDFFPPPDGLRDPELPNECILSRIQTLHQPIRQERAGLAGKPKCFIHNLLHRHGHASRIAAQAKSSTGSFVLAQGCSCRTTELSDIGSAVRHREQEQEQEQELEQEEAAHENR